LLANSHSVHESPLNLGFGSSTVSLASDDQPAADWLIEVLSPWFEPTTHRADWQVSLSSSQKAYAHLCDCSSQSTAKRTCFAHDTRVMAFPSWSDGAGRVALADIERHCFVIVEPSRVALFGDPASKRWRMTSMWTVQEIAATGMRRTAVDVHAAAVETHGRAVLIAGAKGAGKTTLSLHFLRSGRCRSIANDRAFVGGAANAFVVRGMPTAVKLLPASQVEFPELMRGLPRVERPYLYRIDELAREAAGESPSDAGEVLLSPTHLLRQMKVEPLGAAPLGAIVFPTIRGEVDGWLVERLDPRRVAAELQSNLYGKTCAMRPPTVFEELSGGRSAPSADAVEAISESVRGYRAHLGPNAYADPGFAEHMLEAVLG
jgi:hypothetical protein